MNNWKKTSKILHFAVVLLEWQRSKNKPLKGSQVRGMNVWTVGPVAQISEIKHDVEYAASLFPLGGILWRMS